MKPTIILIAVLGCLSVQQIDAFPQYLKEFLEEKVQELENTYKELENKIMLSVKGAQDKLDEELKAAEAKINNVVDVAVTQAAAMSEPCRGPALARLDELRQGFIMRLLNCAHMQDFLDDLGAMVYAGLDLLQALGGSFRAAVEGYLGCLDDVATAGLCVLEQIPRTAQIAVNDTIIAFRFTENIYHLTYNATETIIHCFKDPTDQVQAVLNQAHQCQAPA